MDAAGRARSGVLVAALAVAVGVVVLLTDGGAEPGDAARFKAVTVATGDGLVFLPDPLPDPALPDPVWDEAAELERCNTAPIAELGFPSETFLAYDTATREDFTANARKACRQKVPLTADPGGDMGGTFYFANGRIAVAYCERVVTEHSETCTEPVSDEEAAVRLAAQKAARES